MTGHSYQKKAAAFDKFISSVPELDDARGGYVSVTAACCLGPIGLMSKSWRIFPSEVKWGRKHTIQLGLDIFNVANLFNSEWAFIRP